MRFLRLHLDSTRAKEWNADRPLAPPVLSTDQLVQDSAGSPATLTSLGMVVTMLTWALLICINLWCLRKLFAGESAGNPEA